jgi:hypothetical protein
MSSTNKTATLALNQWVGSVIPKLEDFNQDICWLWSRP